MNKNIFLLLLKRTLILVSVIILFFEFKANGSVCLPSSSDMDFLIEGYREETRENETNLTEIEENIEEIKDQIKDKRKLIDGAESKLKRYFNDDDMVNDLIRHVKDKKNQLDWRSCVEGNPRFYEDCIDSVGVEERTDNTCKVSFTFPSTSTYHECPITGPNRPTNSFRINSLRLTHDVCSQSDICTTGHAERQIYLPINGSYNCTGSTTNPSFRIILGEENAGTFSNPNDNEILKALQNHRNTKDLPSNKFCNNPGGTRSNGSWFTIVEDSGEISDALCRQIERERSLRRRRTSESECREAVNDLNRVSRPFESFSELEGRLVTLRDDRDDIKERQRQMTRDANRELRELRENEDSDSEAAFCFECIVRKQEESSWVTGLRLGLNTLTSALGGYLAYRGVRQSIRTNRDLGYPTAPYSAAQVMYPFIASGLYGALDSLTSIDCADTINSNANLTLQGLLNLNNQTSLQANPLLGLLAFGGLGGNLNLNFGGGANQNLLLKNLLQTNPQLALSLLGNTGGNQLNPLLALSLGTNLGGGANQNQLLQTLLQSNPELALSLLGNTGGTQINPLLALGLGTNLGGGANQNQLLQNLLQANPQLALQLLGNIDTTTGNNQINNNANLELLLQMQAQMTAQRTEIEARQETITKLAQEIDRIQAQIQVISSAPLNYGNVSATTNLTAQLNVNP